MFPRSQHVLAAAARTNSNCSERLWIFVLIRKCLLQILPPIAQGGRVAQHTRYALAEFEVNQRRRHRAAAQRYADTLLGPAVEVWTIFDGRFKILLNTSN